jgi:hypothetical protein
MLAYHYKAFMSYSHTADTRLAPALQKGLQRLGKPWYRRSVFKIFRDDTSLAASPGLWSKIETNLAQCEYFLLLASPNAAASLWVQKEVQWWITHRSLETLFLIITGGDIAWDSRSGDFDWTRTTCLPPQIRGLHGEEPLFVDLRWAIQPSDRSLRNPRFRAAVLTLAASLLGCPKDQLDSEDLRAHRRSKIVVSGALLLLCGLIVLSLYGLRNARREAANAERNWREAESRRLAAVAVQTLNNGRDVPRAIFQGVVAWRLAPTEEARNVLKAVQSASADVARIIRRHTEGVSAVTFSPDSWSQVAMMGASDFVVSLRGPRPIPFWVVSDWRSTRCFLMPPEAVFWCEIKLGE